MQSGLYCGILHPCEVRVRIQYKCFAKSRLGGLLRSTTDYRGATSVRRGCTSALSGLQLIRIAQKFVPNDGGGCTHIYFLNILFGAHTRRHHLAQSDYNNFSTTMTIQENVSLSQYTTFKIGGSAKFFCLINSENELIEAIDFARQKNVPVFVIGGGSNLLVSDTGFSGLVIKFDKKGFLMNDGTITAYAGEDWDNFVEETLRHGYCGLENLSAIPGTVGASPVQNIGAYGVEVSEFIESVFVYDLKNGNFQNLTKNECQFSYRDSIFKQQKGRFIILKVTFRLKKDDVVNTEYKDLSDYFNKLNLERVPTPSEVRKAVIEIRYSKLPDWQKWGTAGSFFKNPIIPIQQYVDLKQKYTDLPGFPECDGSLIKVSLGWILDKICNAKGLSVGNAYVYEKQALVLVAKPGAKASDVIELSRRIQDMVKEKTGIVVEAEVEWVN